MSAAIRDVRRGAEPGAVEITLCNGEVFHLLCQGLHWQEQGRVQAAVLAAFEASGLTVVGA